MNKQKYYLDELIEDEVLCSLAIKAKAILQYNQYVIAVYRKYAPLLFGQSPKHLIDLVKLNKQSIVLNCQRSSCSSPKQSKESTSSDTKIQATSTPVKKISNISILKRKYLPFDDAGNEASQNVTTSQEKQLTPVKIIRNAIEPDILPQKNLPNISSDQLESYIVSTNRRKQLTPKKVNRNATEAENFPHKRSPLGYKEIDKAEPISLESPTPVRPQKVIVSPKKIDTTILNLITEVDMKYVSPNAQDPETAGNPEADKREPEISDEAIKKPVAFTVNVKEDLNTHKAVGVDGVISSDVGKNYSPKEKTTALYNQKPSVPAEETVQIIQRSEGEKCYFSPVKKAKTSSNPAKNVQKSLYSDNKSKMIARTVQDSKMNISPNQGSRLFKTFEGKRKSPSPRTDTVLFSSIPRIIQSSRGVEIEIDNSCLSAETPSPTTSPISLRDYKIIKTVTYENIDKDRSPKDVNLSVNEPKPGCSKDISTSVKDSITSSPPVLANSNSPIRDCVIDLGKDRLSYKPSKGSPPTNPSSATLSSLRIKNLDSKTLVYCITQLSNLISKREACMRHIYNSLIGFSKGLDFLKTHTENMMYVIQNIPIVNKDYVTEDIQKNIFCFLTTASIFIKKLGSWKSDVQLDIECWTKCFQQIHKIKSLNEPLMSNDTPLVNIEVLHAYEERLKAKWDTLDDTIPALDSRRSLFFATADDFEKCINLFVKCLITIGVLKPSSTPVL